MKRALAVALVGTSLFLAAEEPASTVRFSNNDRLSGSIESLSPETLVWKSPVLEKSTPFFLKDVLDLTLVPAPPQSTASHEASVSLTNGDMLRGRLASVSDETIELDTWFAGRMKLNRLMVSDIRINQTPDLIYRGPTGLEDWKQAPGSEGWTYQNGSFQSSSPGSIARDMKLPDECCIAFDIAWRGSLSLDLGFFSDGVTTGQTDGYVMTIRNRYLSVRNSTNQLTLGEGTTAEALQENEKARIEIRGSVKTGKICVFVDGEIINVWTDPDVAKLEIGRGLRFVAPTKSPVRISRIDVARWDGEVDQVPEPKIENDLMDEDEAGPASERPPVAKPDPGRMELRNGDSLDGQVQSIEGDMISIKTPFRDVKIPIEVLRSVALKPVEQERSKRENGDVRGWFADGSSVVFRLENVKPGILSGSSQNFGNVEFKTAAFNRIEFNIYDPQLEDLRAAEKW